MATAVGRGLPLHPGLGPSAWLGVLLALAPGRALARTTCHASAGACLEIPGSWVDQLDGRRLLVRSADGSLTGLIWTPAGAGLGTRGGVLERLGLIETSRGVMPAGLQRDLAPGRSALAAELVAALDGPRLGRTWFSSRGPLGLQTLGKATASGRPVAFEAGLLATERPLVYVFFAESSILNLRLSQIDEMVASLRVTEPPVELSGAAAPGKGPPASSLAGRIERLRKRVTSRP